MVRKVALIAGASGHVGSQLAEELAGLGEWDVVSLSRTGETACPGVRSVRVDLLSGEIAAAISAFPKPTHVFYCARAPHREGAAEDVETNLAMLQHIVAAGEIDNTSLEHVHIVEGGKWYVAATTPDAANEAFNVTNGDAIRWFEIWPTLAASFKATPGVPRNFSLAAWARDKNAVWERVVRERKLTLSSVAEVANWSFGDFVFGQDYDVLSDVSKIRRAGFDEALDSTAMVLRMLGDYRAMNILP